MEYIKKNWTYLLSIVSFLGFSGILWLHVLGYRKAEIHISLSNWLYTGSLFFLILFCIAFHAIQKLVVRSTSDESKAYRIKSNLVAFSVSYVLVLAITHLTSGVIVSIQPFEFVMYFILPTILSSAVTSMVNHKMVRRENPQAKTVH